MPGGDFASSFRSSRSSSPPPTPSSGVRTWHVVVLLVSLGCLAGAVLSNLDKISFSALLPGFFRPVPAAEQALLVLTSDDETARMPPLHVNVYKMSQDKIRLAPANIREKLSITLRLITLGAPDWMRLVPIAELDTTEPNTAMVRGLALAQGGGEWGIELIRSAADKGLVPAQALLGLALIANPALQQKNGASGVDWLRKAIASGDIDAMHALAYATLQGKVTGSPPADGVDLLRRAAQAGSIASMKLLASMLARGYIVSKDLALAEEYSLKAANAGDGNAQAYFGMYLVSLAASGQPERLPEAVRHFTNASKAELIDTRRKAMYGMGMLKVEWAKEPPLRNTVDGIRWFQRCADWGYRDCYYALGHAYENAQGVGADVIKAAAFYKAAYELGMPKGRDGFNRVFGKLSDIEKDKIETEVKALLGRSGAAEQCIKDARLADDCLVLPDGRVPTFRQSVDSKRLRN